MNKIKRITKHGQDEMIFHCDSCENTVAIDTFDVLKAEGDLHCPVCGAESDNLELLTSTERERT